MPHEPSLYALEYAKENLWEYELPTIHGNYGHDNATYNNVLEQLLKALPKCNGVEIYDFHVTEHEQRYDAAFTWRYPNLPYTCTTKYWGDGIYHLTGITQRDQTVVTTWVDDHSQKIIGDDICTELLEALQKEEEYEHVSDGYIGGLMRGRRLPEMVTKKQLLLERAELIKKRKRAIDKLKDAYGMGIKFWERAIERYEAQLVENADLLAAK